MLFVSSLASLCLPSSSVSVCCLAHWLNHIVASKSVDTLLGRLVCSSKPAKQASTAPTVAALTQAVELNGVVLVFELSINVPSLVQVGALATRLLTLQPFTTPTHTVLCWSTGTPALNTLSLVLQPKLIAAANRFDFLQVAMPLRLATFDFVPPVAQFAKHHVWDTTFPCSA